MKRTIEQQLVDATPRDRGNRAFVSRTMQAVYASTTLETFTGVLRKTSTPKRERLFMKLKHLPIPAIVALVITVLLLTSGTIYAAIRFAPDLINILSKSTNETGRVEYEVPSFTDCQRNAIPKTDKFQLKKDAPTLNDNEVKKIIQAKCEMRWLNDFVSNTWPAYSGDHGRPKSGEDFYYTRLDVMGTLDHIDKKSAAIVSMAGVRADYQAVPDHAIEVYAGGKKVSTNQLKPGDVTFSVVRVNEKYFDRCTTSCDTQPRTMGLVALIRLSLPAEYYGKMQGYLSEVPECMGNNGEYCQQTFPQIDIFPREGGEGARNPAIDTANNIRREIIGKVTSLGSDTLTLQTTRDTTYSVTVAADAFDEYNSTYAPNYHDPSSLLQIGDTVSIVYNQSAGDDPHIIALDQVNRVMLLFESSNPKEQPLKKY